MIWRKILLSLSSVILLVLTFNASFLSHVPDAELRIIAHRGVHQTFHRENLTNQTCTAERIFEPTHSLIENTIPSIEAAFEYGADIVEIDVIRTADGEFAVFHDSGLDCRTNGAGRTADHSMNELRALDLAYGYTADGGQTYPLRGQGVGLMPTLAEVLTTFPTREFIINNKGNRAEDADVLFGYLNDLAQLKVRDRFALFGGPVFAARWRDLNTGIIVGTKHDAKNCAKDYLLTGWFGHTPKSCLHYGLVAPEDLAWLYWGWPQK